MVYDIHHPYISCELAEVSAPSDIKQVFDQACDHGSVFIQAFGKLLLELARGGEAKTLLGSQIVNIPNLMDLNREVVPEHPGGSYREVVNACLVFPKTLRGEQKAWEEAQKRAPRQTPDVPVSAQDLIFRQIVEPLRKAVDDLGSEAWRPANLDLKAGAIRLDALASSVSPCLTASAMGVTKVEATGPHLLSVQSPSEQQKDTANITRSPDTPDQVAISPSIHLGFGTCLAFPKYVATYVTHCVKLSMALLESYLDLPPPFFFFSLFLFFFFDSFVGGAFSLLGLLLLALISLYSTRGASHKEYPKASEVEKVIHVAYANLP